MSDLTEGQIPAVCEATPGMTAAFDATAPLAVRRLVESEIEQAMALTRARLDASVASVEHVRAVLRRNADSVWGIFRFGEEALPGAEILGFYSMLLLNQRGASLLHANAFDAKAPDVADLAPTGERPAIVYFWAIVAEKLTMTAGPMIARAMGKLYAGVPIYTTAGTPAGLKKILKSGYRPAIQGRTDIGDLFMLDRYPEDQSFAHPRTAQVRARSRRRNADRYRIVVASTPDEMEKAMRIRAAVYMIEQRCPYEEEFDGNDYSGTMLLGYVDDEPAATLRIRYFANFVKFERLTVLPRFRNTTTNNREIVNAAINVCTRKGYTAGYGHAQLHAMKFWSRFGFRKVETNRRLVFSDHEYVEMESEFPPHAEPITTRSDPYLIVRPEGRSDETGILDHSAARPATNPH